MKAVAVAATGTVAVAVAVTVGVSDVAIGNARPLRRQPARRAGRLAVLCDGSVSIREICGLCPEADASGYTKSSRGTRGISCRSWAVSRNRRTASRPRSP